MLIHLLILVIITFVITLYHVLNIESDISMAPVSVDGLVQCD